MSPVAPGEPYRYKAIGQRSFAAEIEERRNDLATHEVAGSSEDRKHSGGVVIGHGGPFAGLSNQRREYSRNRAGCRDITEGGGLYPLDELLSAEVRS